MELVHFCIGSFLYLILGECSFVRNINERLGDDMYAYEVIEYNRNRNNLSSIIANYQPIISVIKEEVIGFEALSRGISLTDGSIIPPDKMFKESEKNGTSVYLDRRCRDIAFRNFASTYKENHNLHLFVNIEASIIELVNGSNYLLKQVETNEIKPENVIIEINEAKVKDTLALKEFVERYKGLGFIIALDDVGNGFSNLERIPIVKPDIVKVDKSLIQNIEDSYYKQETFKALINLSNKVGAITIAEGIETEKEMVTALEYGAHLLQGYYFSKPIDISQYKENLIIKKIEKASKLFMNHIKEQIKKEKIEKSNVIKLVGKIVEKITNNNMGNIDKILEYYIEKYHNLEIECVYVLNIQGIQITDTIFGKNKENMVKKFIFQPAQIGNDFSNKEYYYELINRETNIYISEPYISSATGNVCKTVTSKFGVGNKEYIICIDIIHKIKWLYF